MRPEQREAIAAELHAGGRGLCTCPKCGVSVVVDNAADTPPSLCPICGALPADTQPFQLKPRE